MKNNQIPRSRLKGDDIAEHKRERNRNKRYRQGRMNLYTLLGKKKRVVEE
jgi:hypothetical protein